MGWGQEGGAFGGGVGPYLFQAALDAGVGVLVDRVGEEVPVFAVEACRARAGDVGADAVVAAPVAACGDEQLGVGVLFVLGVVAGAVISSIHASGRVRR
ncbi:hypothetical protein ACWC4C_38630 [Streptomyces olivaceoviridis]